MVCNTSELLSTLDVPAIGVLNVQPYHTKLHIPDDVLLIVIVIVSIAKSYICIRRYSYHDYQVHCHDNVLKHYFAGAAVYGAYLQPMLHHTLHSHPYWANVGKVHALAGSMIAVYEQVPHVLCMYSRYERLLYTHIYRIYMHTHVYNVHVPHYFVPFGLITYLIHVYMCVLVHVYLLWCTGDNNVLCRSVRSSP